MITIQRLEDPLLELNIAEQVPFAQFIKEIHPHLSRHPLLPRIASNSVSGLHELCEEEYNGSFATIRGGAMRTFIFQTQEINTIIGNKYGNLDFKYKGSEPFTAQIIDNIFGLKDIDILIRRNSQVRQNDRVVIVNFARQLLESGFAQVEDSVFSNGQYRVEIQTQAIGMNTKRTFFKVDFFENGSQKPLLKLDIGDYPAKNEVAEDIRNTPEAAKIDRLARGKLILRNGNPVLIYDRKPLDDFLLHVFLDPEKKYQGFGNLSVPQLIGGLRTAGFAAFFTPFLLAHPEISGANAMSFFIRYWPRLFEQSSTQSTLDWIKTHHQEFNQRRPLIVRDVIYPQTINPIVLIAHAYLSGHLAYLPLGKIINDEKKLFAVLYKITEIVGGDFYRDSFLEVCMKNAKSLMGPLNILASLKELKLLSYKYPLNMDTAVALADPLRYDEF